MTTEYNQIFSKLVLSHKEDSAEQLVGMLAYAEYKLQKQEYCQNFHEEHQVDPGEDKIAEFIRTFNERRLEQLKKEATETLISFAEALLEENVQENINKIIEESIVSEISQNNEKALKEVKRQNRKLTGFFISLAASIAFSVFIFIGAALITINYPDSTISKIFKVLTHNDLEISLTKKQ